MARWVAAVSSCMVLGGLIIVGCGSDDDSKFPESGEGANGGGSGNGDGFGNGGGGGGGGGDGPCEGLECKQVACSNGGTTSLTGTVFDPSGTVALYNAVVYVPNAPVEPFKPGVSCDQCGTAPSGKPIATALTDARGQFTLKNVPVGVDVPLVIQIGRWRRQVTIPAANVTECASKPIAATFTRLPRSRKEGDIPKIAITTGWADSLECFVRKLGIDPAEFTNPAKDGRVNLYVGKQMMTMQDQQGQSFTFPADGSKIDAATPPATSLWNSAAELKKYDIVILSCEGAENNTTKSAPARSNLQQYLNAGGRVFNSHFHYTWYKNSSATALPKTATWVANDSVGNANVSVDTTFAKGNAFSQWLDFNKATTSAGSKLVAMKELRENVTKVPGAGAAPDVSRRWLYTGTAGQATERTKFYSFNAPVGAPAANQCGRGVYTDIHVSAGDVDGLTAPGGQGVIPDFPANCTSKGFTPQEKALLFMLFDLSACIQDDSKPPEAPPPAIK